MSLKSLTNRWSNNWKLHRLSKRLQELAIQFFFCLIFTLAILASAGGAAAYLLPPSYLVPCVEFLALIYLCLLGIETARLFDREELLHRLAEIEDAVEHSNNNLTSENINALTVALEELTIRMGIS
jgi:hypothetical protein